MVFPCLHTGRLAALTTWMLLIQVAARPGAGIVRVSRGPPPEPQLHGFTSYFVDRDCMEFQFSGWNSAEVFAIASGNSSLLPPDLRGNDEVGKQIVYDMLMAAEAAGLSLGRFFGEGRGRSGFRVQKEVGDYDERAFKAMDWVIAAAGAAGLKVVFPLVDGEEELDWYRRVLGLSDGSEFFTDDGAKKAFKDHVEVVLNRENAMTGVRNKDNPTIFAWALLNHPRCGCGRRGACESPCQEGVNEWIGEMSLWLKQLDPHHMVVVGEEGFYSDSRWRRWVNPDAFFDLGQAWAQRSGQDFIQNHFFETIDFLSVQSLPDEWGVPHMWFQDIWVREHVNDAWWMDKPLVIEAFGKIADNDDGNRELVRDPFFTKIYEHAEMGVIKGVAFLELDVTNGSDPGAYGIRPGYATWENIIQPHSLALNKRLNARPLIQNCVPGARVSMDAVFVEDSAVYYVTNGPNLVGTDESEDDSVIRVLDGQNTISECVDACEGQPGTCTRFWYRVKSGECVLKTGGGDAKIRWNAEGWQAFWRRIGSTERCGDNKCALCNKDSHRRCLKCNGSRLFLDDLGRPVCK